MMNSTLRCRSMFPTAFLLGASVKYRAPTEMFTSLRSGPAICIAHFLAVTFSYKRVQSYYQLVERRRFRRGLLQADCFCASFHACTPNRHLPHWTIRSFVNGSTIVALLLLRCAFPAPHLFPVPLYDINVHATAVDRRRLVRERKSCYIRQPSTT